jgi:hypothetical protein
MTSATFGSKSGSVERMTLQPMRLQAGAAAETAEGTSSFQKIQMLD